MLKYIIPFLYTHAYNRKGIESIAYFLEYYVALGLFTFLSTNSVEELFIYIISLITLILVYEMGYIENNILAIALDKSPTLRHTQEETNNLKNNLKKIFLIRYLFIIILLSYLSFYTNIWLLTILLLLTRIIYFLYNMKFRKGLIHRLLFGFLRFLRYWTPISFLGITSLFAVLPITLVNIINHYAWYDRTAIHLPRFFGTKIFDAIIYSIFFILFKAFGYNNHAYLFLYLVIIKLLLFMFVLFKRGQFYNV